LATSQAIRGAANTTSESAIGVAHTIGKTELTKRDTEGVREVVNRRGTSAGRIGGIIHGNNDVVSERRSHGGGKNNSAVSITGSRGGVGGARGTG